MRSSLPGSRRPAVLISALLFATVTTAAAQLPSSGKRYPRLIVRNAIIIEGNGTPASGPKDIVIENNRGGVAARWGLDWILKTSFGDGYRNQGSVSSRWTDGILGNSDDIASTARNTPMGNFTASASEAIAARVLKESDPRLAAYCRTAGR
jgi:hypothetical protein